MCTVTFLPTPEGVVITSSRDEHINRGVALAPEIRQHAGANLIYPVDVKAGGTWFVVNEQGAVGVLLNGAIEKHEPKPPYAMSRGQWLLQLFNQQNIVAQLVNMNLVNMEPFTLVLWHNEVLHQYQWDGLFARHLLLDIYKPHIWSSSTLYNHKMRAERKGWFTDWLLEQPTLNIETALAFHEQTAPNNKKYGLKIKRSNGLQTASITSAYLSYGAIEIRHYDTLNNQQHHLQTSMPFPHL